MSSGLVASMALPAHAVGNSPAEINGPQTASIPAVAGGSSAFFAAPEGGLLSLPAGLAVEDGTVSAPATATLDFDHPSFVAVPTPDGITAPPAQPSADLGRQGARTGSTTTAAAPKAAAQPATRRAARSTTSSAPARSSSSSSTSSSSSSSSGGSVAVAPASGLGAQAVAIASRYLGVPYRYGGESPSGFDCSGLVQYVYAQLGRKLPRTADVQAAAVKHIPRSQAKPGDLVLFPGGGHIAIYLGGNMMLDAPHTGTVVQIRKIYSASVSFGRVY